MRVKTVSLDPEASGRQPSMRKTCQSSKACQVDFSVHTRGYARAWLRQAWKVHAPPRSLAPLLSLAPKRNHQKVVCDGECLTRPGCRLLRRGFHRGRYTIILSTKTGDRRRWRARTCSSRVSLLSRYGTCDCAVPPDVSALITFPRAERLLLIWAPSCTTVRWNVPPGGEGRG